MAKSLARSVYHQIHPDLRTLPWHRALRIQQKLNRRCSQPDPPVFQYALKTQEQRRLHRAIEEGNKPGYLRQTARNPQMRVFREFENYLRGDSVRKLITKFAQGVNGDKIFQSNSSVEVSAKDYFSLLLSNSALSKNTQRVLVDLHNGNTNRSPGLGPSNERRAAIALAILQDEGMVSGFQLCGEAGKSLRMKQDASLGNQDNALDYSHHEEAMAVDLMVKLDFGMNNFYLPLQIKSSGSNGIDSTQRYLNFTNQEKDFIVNKAPFIRELFVEDLCHPGKHRMLFTRNVLKIALSDRKIIKTHRRDFEDDIANKILALIEYAIEHGQTMPLKQAYQSYSYPEKVLLMIKSGFLKPILDKDHQLDF
jgi:hypothetical protein